MIDHEVQITVDAECHRHDFSHKPAALVESERHRIDTERQRIDFSYRPTTLYVRHGDRVHWVSPDGPFAIQFTGNTPSDRMGTHGELHGDVWRSASIPIRVNARGHFPYGGAVSLQNGRFEDLMGRVALDVGCPEIIVD